MTNEMFQQYRVLVDFLGKALGPSYEIALHDLDSDFADVAAMIGEKADPRSLGSIIAIANSDVSGRSLGSPLTNVALKMLAQKQYETVDYKLNYTGQLPSGKMIRSSTMFIKDESGTPVGLLCVNFDGSKFQEAGESLLRLVHPDNFVSQHYTTMCSARSVDPDDAGEEATENYHSSVADLMDEIFNEVASSVHVSLDRLTQDERTRFVYQLNERGMFRLKGAVQYVAERLACSQASIYRYLNKVKNT